MGIQRTIGRLLRPFRAGGRQLMWNDPRLRKIPDSIVLTSSAFADGAAMPLRYAGAGVGDNVSPPPLRWSGLPAGTVELVLVMQDPDAPLPRPVTHLIARIPPGRGHVEEGVLVPGKDPAIGFGRGTFGRIGYAGPRPPAGHGPHRYIFEIYAVTERWQGPAVPDLSATIAAGTSSALARGRLTGIFERA
jgi:Raf kinase inhibitor-like YbhB/YbcL family protein